MTNPSTAEALLKGLFDAAGMLAGVVEDLGDDYRYALANRGVCEFYGLPEGGLTGQTGLGMSMPASQIADRLEIFRRGHATGQPEILETPFTTPGGRSGWFLITFAPLPTATGTAPQTSFVAIDITAAKQAELARARQGELLAMALEATHLGFWEFNLQTRALSWDARCRELYGLGPGDEVTYETYMAAMHPSEKAAHEAIFEAALRGENGGGYIREHRAVNPSGYERWVEGAARVIFDNGRPVRVLGTLRDIDERVRTRQRQSMLLAELNHRVKNNLAMVQALASHTLRSTPEPQAFREAFEARLQSLAGAHDLLTRNVWETAELVDVVTKALEPFPASCLRTEGPHEGVRVRPAFAVSLALLIHELGTNAVKYGALKGAAGQVAVSWDLTADEIRIDWRETGGPPVTPPTRIGLGTRLIRRSIAAAGGHANIDYRPDGLAATFAIPLSAGVNQD